jgi:hypothetical protein
MPGGGGGAMGGGTMMGAAPGMPMGGTAGDMEKGYARGDQGVNSEIGTANDSPSSERLSRGADVAKLGFLSLLGGLALNAFSFNAGADANALAWIAFAFFVIWAFVTMLTRSRWVPLVMGLITFPIVIALYSVAFNIDRSAVS